MFLTFVHWPYLSYLTFLSELFLIFFYSTLLYFILFHFILSIFLVEFFSLYTILLCFLINYIFPILFNSIQWLSVAYLSSAFYYFSLQGRLLPTGNRLQCWHSCHYFIASCHLALTEWNAYSRAYITLFLTELWALFMLCVHMYCDCDCTVVVWPVRALTSRKIYALTDIQITDL